MNLAQITQQYLDIFPGDLSGKTEQRNTPKVLFSTVKPEIFDEPKLILYNNELSEQIGLGKYTAQDLPFLVGNQLPANVKTYSTAYAGHQFGNWAGQLGDGRAIFAGEIVNSEGIKTEIQWKGVGATPYSRFADGRAVLRSSLREYLMSEAMFHLGVPTTRSLSLAFTGEGVMRDILYNGNPQEESGAAMIRTAESFLRFGHFELVAAQQEEKLLKQLADFCISSYFTKIDSDNPDKYKLFFTEVCNRTAELMVHWLRVGFVHGVMNTDNMSVLGLTIDYGPFSMLEEFDLNFTPNTTDLPGRRYAFGKQPQIAQWNLWQLSNALFPLIQDAEFLEKTLEDFSENFWQKHDQMMASKLGFDNILEGDENIFVQMQQLMTDHKLDYSLFFKFLEKNVQNVDGDTVEKISYNPVSSSMIADVDNFLQTYHQRLALNKISRSQSVELMRKTNPAFVLRNYLLFECIAEVESGKNDLLNRLVEALKSPYEEIFPELSAKRPAEYNQVPGCSTLSCSS